MKEDLTENPQKGELNFGEKFNIFYLIFYKRYMEWPIFLLSDSFME